jgi:hypothetical protein
LEILCSEFVLHQKRIENGNFGFRVSSAWDALFIPLLKSLFFVLEQCSFVEHRNYKIIYRRYASLFFLVGVDGEENELAILEFIHCVVETMDRYFGNVCELDIMFHLEKAHFMLEEMVMNGCIVETNKVNILTPIQLMDKSS